MEIKLAGIKGSDPDNIRDLASLAGRATGTLHKL